MPAEHRDIADIRTALLKRRDIGLFPAERDDGVPPIIGTQLRRVTETEVRGPDSYHPFTYRGWKYYGQSFAVDRAVRGKLNKEQLAWKADFELLGGVYVTAADMRDVITALGNEPDDVIDYLGRKPMKPF